MTDRLRFRGRSGSRPRARAAAAASRWTTTSSAIGSTGGLPHESARGGDLLGQPGRGRAEQPDHAARAGHRDRAVPELHGRVGLGPHPRRFPQLERGLAGQPARPAGPEEGELARAGQRRGSGTSSARRAAAATGPMSCPRCARSRASSVVANLVCTTDCSSANSSVITASAAAATGLSAVGGDRHRRRGPGHPGQQIQDLGRRPRPGQARPPGRSAVRRASRRRRTRRSRPARTPRAAPRRTGR